MSDTLKRECPHCHGSLDRYEDPVVVKLIDNLTRELATRKHWLGDLERIQQLERELAQSKLALDGKQAAIKAMGQTISKQEQQFTTLREAVEKLAAEYTRLADTSDDEDFITEKRALARELRALLK